MVVLLSANRKVCASKPIATCPNFRFFNCLSDEQKGSSLGHTNAHAHTKMSTKQLTARSRWPTVQVSTSRFGPYLAPVLMYIAAEEELYLVPTPNRIT